MTNILTRKISVLVDELFYFLDWGVNNLTFKKYRVEPVIADYLEVFKSEVEQRGSVAQGNSDEIWDAIGGHSSSWNSNPTSGQVISKISAGRPLGLAGCVSWVNPANLGKGSCHFWAVDGYKNYRICPSGNEYFYAHMQWGWGSTSGRTMNGWYNLLTNDPDGNGNQSAYWESIYKFYPN